MGVIYFDCVHVRKSPTVSAFVQGQVAQQHGVVPAKKLLAKEGYDPQFGARPLKRVIQQLVLDPPAIRLLDAEFRPGNRIKASANDGELVFAKG